MQSLWSNRGGGQGLLAGIAVILILVGAYFIFKEAKSGKDDEFGNVYYYCTNCEKEFTDSTDKVPPIKCPHCRQVAGAAARKFKCSECNTTFVGYIQKYDPQTQLAIERRKKGEKVDDTQIQSIQVSEPGTDDWVDASSPEGTDIMTNITCPSGCEGTPEPVFPEFKKKK